MKSLLIIGLAVVVLACLLWHFRGELALIWFAHRYLGWWQ